MKNNKILSLLFFCIALQTMFCQEALINSTIEIKDELINKQFKGNGNENISGQKVGLWNFFCTENYYKDKDIVISGNYDENKKIGEWNYSYKSTGLPLLLANYKNGLLNGELKAYYTDGKLKEKTNYLNGIKQGEYIEYANDDDIRVKIIYDNGYKVKMFTYRYTKGKMGLRGEYIYEVCRGYPCLKNIKAYWDNSQLMFEGDFNERGVFINKWSVFYPSGNLFVQGVFSARGPDRGNNYDRVNNSPRMKKLNTEIDGVDFLSYYVEKLFDKGNYDGNWQYYYDNGNLQKSLNYNNGLQTGIQKYYHKNGKLKKEGMAELERGDYGYLRSFNTGVWESYDENGDLINVSYKTFKKSGGYYSTYLNYEARYEDNVLRYEKKHPPGKNPVIKEYNKQGQITIFEHGWLYEKFSYSYNQENNLTEKNISYKRTEKKEFFDTNGNIIGIKRIGDWSKITPEEYEKNVKILRDQDVEYDFRAEAKSKVEAKVKADAEAKAKSQAEAKAKSKAELEAKVKAEAEAKAQAEAEAKAQAEAEAKAKVEVESKVKVETKEQIENLELWYSSEKSSDFYLKQFSTQVRELNSYYSLNLFKIEIHRVPGNEDATEAFTFYYFKDLNGLKKLEQLSSENKSVNLYHKNENNLLLVYNAKK